MSEREFNIHEMREALLDSNRFGAGFLSDAGLLERAKDYDPVACATVIAGMLVNPEMHANTYRLEALVHFFVCMAKGTKSPDKSIISDAFEAFGKTYGLAEDPAEDVFVSLVSSCCENYRIFEGTWEASTFILQRFVDVLEHMPKGEPFAGLKKSSFAMLRVSEAVAEKNKINRYQVGAEYPQFQIPSYILENLDTFRESIKLSASELKSLDLSISDLDPFILATIDAEEILDTNLGYSPLERRPLIRKGDDIYLLLPAAISTAIRRFVVEGIDSIGELLNLELALANAYAMHFHEIQILGDYTGAPINFSLADSQKYLVAELYISVDTGRYLHLLFVCDGFENASSGWFSGYNSDPKELSDDISSRIKNTRDQMGEEQGFKEALSLIVACGWGRAQMLGLTISPTNDWKIESISAYDLTILSASPGMSCLGIMRMLEGKKILSINGVHLENINGLVNLYAWAKSLGHHLVPHENLPERDMGEHISLYIAQNSLLQLRREVLNFWDFHIAITPDDLPVKVGRESSGSYFREDRERARYVSFTDIQEQRLNAYIQGVKRRWWCRIEFQGEPDKNMSFRLWEAACSWVATAESILEDRYDLSKFGFILWDIKVSKFEFPESGIEPLGYKDAIASISFDFGSDGKIAVGFSEHWSGAFYGEFNDGERSLVYSLIKGIQTLAGVSESDEETEALLDRIIPDRWAKNIHLFYAQSQRDLLAQTLPRPLYVEKADDASMRIGLGWLAQDRNDGNTIEGIENCTAYLGKLVGELWKIIQAELKTFNRKVVIKSLLENLEAIYFETARWKRTVRSTLSLHEDKEDVINVTIEQMGSLHAASAGSRIAIEMALCECPEGDGADAGKIEMTKILAYAALMHHIGNWSDSIKYKLRPAKVKISPLGDILFDNLSDESIVVPYAKSSQSGILEGEADRYSKLFAAKKIVPSIEDQFDQEFLKAWLAEYNFSIDECRRFIDSLEDRSVKRGTLVFEIKYQDLLDLDGLPCETNQAIMKAFTLWPRETWAMAPEGYANTDWYPWRFRRKLSFVTKPIIQLSDKEDKECLISPGLLRDGFNYVLDNCFTAGFDENYFVSNEMRSWVGRKRNQVGHSFNEKVATKFKQLGWHAEHDIELPHILNQKLDKAYGDVDVLAWNSESCSILAIECKDLQFAKTEGEIARQLYEFRGKDNNKGKPDRLKKHQERVRVLNENNAKVQKYTDLPSSTEIETVLMFSKVVPMSFASDAVYANITVVEYEAVESIFNQEGVVRPPKTSFGGSAPH